MSRHKVGKILITLFLISTLILCCNYSVYALTKDETVETTETSEFMKYSTSLSGKCFNIEGKYNDQIIRTTFSNAGYVTAVQIGSNSKTDISGYANGDVVSVNGVDIQIKLSMVENGRAVRVDYIAQNNNSYSTTVKIGSSADTQVGNNDSAQVVKSSTEIKMTDTNTSSSTYGAQFKLTGDFSTTWVGGYSSAYSNMFTNGSSTSYTGDSGLAFSWQYTIAAGQTVTKSCEFKVDSVLELGDCTVTADRANAQLLINAPYYYQSGKVQELYYAIDGSSTFSKFDLTDTAGSNGNGCFENVTLDVSGLDWEDGSSHTISFYIKDKNGVLKTRILTYSVYWPISTVEGETLKTIKFANTYTLFADILNKEGAVIVLPSDSWTGYAFLGWDTVKEGTGTRYKAGDSYTISGDAVLYAQWVPACKATVVVRKDGSVWSDASVELCNDAYGKYDNDVSVPSGTYSIWVNGNDTGKTLTVSDAPVTQYIDYYTLTFNTMGGSLEGGNQITVLKGAVCSNFETPIKQCHIFEGWNTLSTGNGTYYDEITVNSATVLYAVWTENHSYGEYIYNYDATTTADGTKTSTCAVCGNQKTMSVPGTKDLEILYQQIISANSEIDAVENITSDNKDTVTYIIEKSKDILDNNSEYLSEDRITGLNTIVTDKQEILNDITALEDKLSAVQAANDLLKEITVDNVTNDSKDDLTSLLEQAQSVLSENINNLTEAQKTAMNDIVDKADNRIEKIEEVDEAVSSIITAAENIPDKATVKTTDKENVENLLTQSSNALTNYKNNLTEEQKNAIKDIVTAAQEKENRIEYIEDSVSDVISNNELLPSYSNSKSSDKESIEAVNSDANDLLTDYSSNLTEEQQSKLNTIRDFTKVKLERIEETAKLIEDVKSDSDGVPSVETVNLDNKKTIQNIIIDAETIMDDYSGNLTEEEKSELSALIETASEKLTRISTVSAKVTSVETANNSLPSLENVKAADKDAITEVLNKALEVKEQNSNNFNEAQATLIDDIITSAREKLARIQYIEDTKQQVQEDLDNLPDLSDINSDNKDDITDIIDKINDILENNDENLTDEDKQNLQNVLDDAKEKLEEIEKTEEEIKAAEDADTESPAKEEATSDDKKELEKLVEQAKKTLEERDGNLTEAEKEKLQQIIDTNTEKLEEIEKTAEEIKASEDADTESPTKEEATSDDKEELEKLVEQAKKTLEERDGNLTEAEKEKLQQIIDTNTEKLEEIEKTAEEIKASEDADTESPKKEEATSDDKEDLEKLVDQAKKTLEERDGNLTEAEKEKLQQIIDSNTEKLEEIEKTEEEIKAAEDADTESPAKEEATSDDKKELEKLVEQAKKTLEERDGNLTEAEKEKLQQIIDTNTEKLEEIEKTAEEIKASEDADTESPTKEEATSDDKEDLEKLVEQAKKTLEERDGNLTEAEKEKLQQIIDSNTEKLEEIEKTVEEIKTSEDADAESPAKEEATSDDKEDLEKLVEQAKKTLEERDGNLTEAEKEKLQQIIDSNTEKLEEIEKTAEEIKTSEDADTESPAKEEATSDDKEDLEKLVDQAKKTLEERDGNLTEAEKEKLQQIIDTNTEKLEEIEKTAEEIQTSEDADAESPAKEEATSDDKEDLEKLVDQAKKTLEERDGNLTEAEKEKLQQIIDSNTEKLEEIEKTAEEIQTSEDADAESPAKEEATSDDKEDLEKLVEQAKKTLEERDGNLTESEKEKLQQIIDSNTEKLVLITKVEYEMEQIILKNSNLPSKESILIEHKATIEEMKNEIQQYLDTYSNNLTVSEKERLNRIIVELQEKYDYLEQLKVPETGDTQNGILYLMIMMLSGIVITRMIRIKY